MSKSNLLSKLLVAELIGCHPRTIMRHVNRGNFPAPIRMGDHGHPRWDAEVVQEWITEQKGERQPKESATVEQSDPASDDARR